jgi:hypothetical protein
MKRVIDGKIYDTKTARQVAPPLHFAGEVYSMLFCTRKGAYFLQEFREGANGGWHIVPLSREEAVQFVIERQYVSILEKEFPEEYAKLAEA